MRPKIENQLNDVQGDVDTIAEVVDTEEFAAIRDNAKDISLSRVLTPGK